MLFYLLNRYTVIMLTETFLTGRNFYFTGPHTHSFPFLAQHCCLLGEISTLLGHTPTLFLFSPSTVVCWAEFLLYWTTHPLFSFSRPASRFSMLKFCFTKNIYALYPALPPHSMDPLTFQMSQLISFLELIHA